MVLRPTYPGIATPVSRGRQLTAGMLLFDHADIMDVTGPWSVLVHNGVRVVSFAKSLEPVTIGMSMELMPDFTLDNLPDVDILVFPGSGLADSNPGDREIQEFIKKRYASTEVLFSVCTGAFFLAESGYLNDGEATTFASAIPRLRKNYPKIKVLDNSKYTDNGKTVTSAGLSSGIDAAFHVVSKFRGEGAVQDVANHMEYPWSRSTEYARSQLADNFISGIKNIVSLFSKQYLYSRGDENSWKYDYLLSGAIPSYEVIAVIKNELSKTSGWKLNDVQKTFLTGTLVHPVLGRGIVRIQVSKSKEGDVVSITAARASTYVAGHDAVVKE